MRKVLMVAEPFGYGPAATLLKCRRELAALPLRWRYLGAEYTLPLLDEGEFEEVYCPASMESVDSLAIRQAMEWADVVFSGTEFRLLQRAITLGKRFVVFDPLFWFWPVVPPVYHPDMTYICQNFVGVRDRVDKLPTEQRRRFAVTSPFLPALEPTPQPKDHLQVIVNFCGLYNPVRRLDTYVEYLLMCLGEALKGTSWKHVLIVGNLPDHCVLPLEDGDIQVRTEVLSHTKMMQEISRTGLVLTCPGLNSALEAMSLGVPVLFLPSANNSQAAQLDVFQSENLVPVRIDWATLSRLGRLWDHPDPATSLNGIAHSLEVCRRSPERTQHLIDALRSSLTLDKLALRSLADRQRAFCRTLCQGDLVTLEKVWATLVVAD